MKEFGDLELVGKTDRIHKPHSIVYIWKCCCGELVEKTRTTARQAMRCYKCNYDQKGLYKGFQEISGTYWQGIIKAAKVRNIEFNITKEYIWDLFIKQDKKCGLTGVQIVLTRNYRNHPEYQTASLDRIDNNVGYLENNVWWVHKDINKLKHTFSMEELLNWSKLIYEYNFSKRTEINSSLSSVSI